MNSMFVMFEGEECIYGVTDRPSAERFVLMSGKKNLTIQQEIINKNETEIDCPELLFVPEADGHYCKKSGNGCFRLRIGDMLLDKFNVVYYGINNLNDKGLPYYTQWGYSKPVISLNSRNSSTIIELNEEQIMQFERYDQKDCNLSWWDIWDKIVKINEKAKIEYKREKQ